MATCSNCTNCFNSNSKKLSDFFEEASLIIFILNIVMNIEKTYGYYCSCKNQNQFLVCATATSFRDIQFGIYQHCLNFNRSSLVVVDLHCALKEKLKEKNHFVCNIINNRYFYSCNNWFSGRKSIYSIDFCLEKWENAIESLRGDHQHKKKIDNLLTNNGFFKIMFDSEED